MSAPDCIEGRSTHRWSNPQTGAAHGWTCAYCGASKRTVHDKRGRPRTEYEEGHRPYCERTRRSNPLSEAMEAEAHGENVALDRARAAALTAARSERAKVAARKRREAAHPEEIRVVERAAGYLMRRPALHTRALGENRDINAKARQRTEKARQREARRVESIRRATEIVGVEAPPAVDRRGQSIQPDAWASAVHEVCSALDAVRGEGGWSRETIHDYNGPHLGPWERRISTYETEGLAWSLSALSERELRVLLVLLRADGPREDMYLREEWFRITGYAANEVVRQQESGEGAAIVAIVEWLQQSGRGRESHSTARRVDGKGKKS